MSGNEVVDVVVFQNPDILASSCVLCERIIYYMILNIIQF